MISGLIVRIIAVTAIVLAAVSPSAAGTANYVLTFDGVLGPNGTGSFSYDDTPGAEWMSDIALDFGVGLEAVVHMEHDPTVTDENPFGNLYLFLFEIFSDTSPYPGDPGVSQWLSIDPYGVGIWPVVEGDGFYRIAFGKHLRLPFGNDTPFVSGPFYQFDGPDVAGDYYYGTIGLSQAAAVPLPAAFPLLAGALACMSVVASRRRRSRTG